MIPKTPFQYQLWINGKEAPSGSGKRFERKSPAHGTVVGKYALAEAGTVWVNTFLEGYPELPFGGFKESG